MDMVNDGKVIRLDTPQAVKEALASGKDLYNPETGEFWWEYNYTGSIANTYVHLDDPNLSARLRCDRTGQLRQGNRVSPVTQRAECR